MINANIGRRASLAAVFLAAVSSGATVPSMRYNQTSCRYSPGDSGWPTEEQWDGLNGTTGGKLLRGIPLAQPCYLPQFDPTRDGCISIQDNWTSAETYYDDPVNVMSPYWLNNTCSPFPATKSSSGCILGNVAAFALDIDSAATAVAGLRFAQHHNIRVSIKNTGHDYLGRSSGHDSLALWTHNLKGMQFLNYSSSSYTGPALKAGAGVQFTEAYPAAAAQGLRIVGGYCSTVGMAGGYVQGGGHGPLASSYGLAADNVLEFEVVTVDGRHLIASPTENPDLYWALSGGGPGNYALVLSLTTKAHTDGPTAGASLAFANTDASTYWAAVGVFQSHLLVLDEVPGFATSWSLSNESFSLNVATLTTGDQSDIETLLRPLIEDLESLDQPLSTYNTTIHPDFYSHFQHYEFPPEVYATNNTVAGRLIPRSTIQSQLPALINVFRSILECPAFAGKAISGNSLNVTQKRTQDTSYNAVLPAWRDALYTLNVAIPYDADASTALLQAAQQQANDWQNLFKSVTPSSGAYMNEATFDSPSWKEDYFGLNYNRLLGIKRKYDPSFVLWQHTSVGADVYWKAQENGRLCRIR